MIQAITGLGAAFGLASSAGLNAYIPLLMVALAAHFPTHDPLLELAQPYDTLASWWAIGLLAVLMLIEMTVDKIPAVDTLNDVVQTFIRPAAGAVLFAASANVVTDVSPILAIACGILVAGGVHTTKGLVRPVVTAATAGTGNWLVSLVEDFIAFFVSLLSILVAPLAVIVLILMGYFVFRVYYRRKQRPAYSK